MKKHIWLPALAVVFAACALLGLNGILGATAEENARKDHLQLMQTLLPGSTSFTLEAENWEDPNILSVHKGQTGFVVQTCVQGYADSVTMLVGVSNEGKVMGLTVSDAHETLGLGSKILTDHEFLAQYLQTDGDAQVDAITGATVTSKAITRSVNSAVAYVTGADIDSGATSWGG